MKKILLVVTLLAVSLFAQDTYRVEDTKIKNEVLIELKSQKTITGVVNTHYESGEIRISTPYKNGVMTGLVKSFYKSGKLGGEAPFVNGKAIGIAKGYYESGKLKSEITFKDGKMSGSVKEYYESGAIKLDAIAEGGIPRKGILYAEDGSKINEFGKTY